MDTTVKDLQEIRSEVEKKSASLIEKNDWDNVEFLEEISSKITEVIASIIVKHGFTGE